LPGCDRHPSRSLARGAQQQPSPPHSGRGHSTAYTHRHFPLPSLVQDCGDGPLALAQAPTPTCHSTCLSPHAHHARRPALGACYVLAPRPLASALSALGPGPGPGGPAPAPALGPWLTWDNGGSPVYPRVSVSTSTRAGICGLGTRY
jgi:hypothetical protein